MRRTAALAVAVTVLTLGSGSVAVADTPSVTLYVTPGVSAPDVQSTARTGRTPAAALPSYERAEEILRRGGIRKATILTPGGTYYPRKEIRWTYDPPGGELTFAAAPGTGPVVFNGTYSTGGYFLRITSKNSNLTISGKKIEKFTTGGIRVDGKSGARVNNVTIKNNTFQKIGNKHKPGGPGYGGVHATGSSNLTITGNKFYYLENTSGPGEIHGVYLATVTNSTKITKNRFGYISGDPIRTRNDSKNNIVSDNMFWRTGAYAIFSDWRFKSESCGKGNVLKNNRYGKSYYDKRFGSGAKQGDIPIKAILWGHDSAKKANLGGCRTAPITDKGGNRYVTSRPW
jgi:hypothetical protein